MGNAKVKRIKRVRTDADKKRALRLTLIIIASVVAAILITGLILGLIPKKGFTDFADYKYVNVSSSSSTQSINNVTEKTSDNTDQYEINKMLKDGLKTTKFSVLRAILEGNVSKAVTFEKTTEEYLNDDDEVKEREVKKMIAGSTIASLAPATATAYSLTFRYNRGTGENPEKFITVEGEKVYYDVIKVAVSADESNIIEDYTVYFYDSEKAGVDEDYEITPVIIKAKLIDLKKAIDAIFEYLK